MRMTQKEVNMAKLINLSNALKDCGIDSEIRNEDGIIGLHAKLLNGVNGNEEAFCVCIEDDNTLCHYVEPQTDIQLLLERLLKKRLVL